MECPYCGGRTAIMQSRQRKKVFQRRHECYKCKQRFSTYEITTEEYEKLNNYKKICECLERLGLHLD